MAPEAKGDDLTMDVEAYMKRVAIDSQRISLGDKDIQGISHTFFLRRKVKTTKPPLTRSGSGRWSPKSLPRSETCKRSRPPGRRWPTTWRGASRGRW